MQDIRFVQRFNNFKRALGTLSEGVAVFEDNCVAGNNVIDLMKQGVIQGFEFVHELSWKTMKDYEEYQGYTNIHGSRDAVRGAFEMGLIQDKAWMKMIEDRNMTSHCYDSSLTDEIFLRITQQYMPLFFAFEEEMKKIVDHVRTDI